MWIITVIAWPVSFRITFCKKKKYSKSMVKTSTVDFCPFIFYRVFSCYVLMDNMPFHYVFAQTDTFFVNWCFKLHYYSTLNSCRMPVRHYDFFSLQLCQTTSRYEVIDLVVHWIVQCFPTYCFVPLTSLHASYKVVTFVVDITLQHRQKLP